MKAGDKIVAIDGQHIMDSDDIKNKLVGKDGSVQLTVDRDGKQSIVNCVKNDKGMIGIAFQSGSEISKSYKKQPYTIGSALYFGSGDAFEGLVSNAKGLRKIFTGQEKASDSVQGPIGIAQIYGGLWDWTRIWAITGLLSMVLAMMNMLPIPALDGGHVVFLTIESLTGKKLSDKFMERAQVVGMVLLLSLMAFAIGNDVWKHVII